ncbi:MAG: hypothetical protein ACYCO9_18455 [Streptosporangiaceae bacterium]
MNFSHPKMIRFAAAARAARYLFVGVDGCPAAAALFEGPAHAIRAVRADALKETPFAYPTQASNMAWML